jgi:uncharacterized repeat protein (TIGR03917 family)
MDDAESDQAGTPKRTRGFAMTWLNGLCLTDEGPGVGVMPWGADAWALVVPAGSSPQALHAALAEMPSGLQFTDAHGDVDLVLVYDASEAEPPRRTEPGAFLRAMLELDPTRVGEHHGQRWMTEGERAAYEAGKADLVDALRRQVIRRRRPRRRPNLT